MILLDEQCGVWDLGPLCPSQPRVLLDILAHRGKDFGIGLIDLRNGLASSAGDTGICISLIKR